MNETEKEKNIFSTDYRAPRKSRDKKRERDFGVAYETAQPPRLAVQRDGAAENCFSYSTRLNGYDVNMINEIAEPTDDDVVRIGVEIAKREDAMEELRSKISATERLGKLPDVINLKIKEKELEREISELKTLYAQKKSLSKPALKSKLKKRTDMPVIRAIQRFISRKILAKVSKKFRSIMALSDSLEMLSGINKSVDELIDMKVPYGENLENYQKLTTYLYKANKIHSQILKSMKK